MRFATIFILLVAASANGQSIWEPDHEQAALAAAWPTSDVPVPRFYVKAKYSQRLTITNERDQTIPYHIDSPDLGRFNPNALFPWAVPGGLHNAVGWRNRVGVVFPKVASDGPRRPAVGGQSDTGRIVIWSERVDAGAERKQVQYRWAFPEGTVFYDVLHTREAIFEIRTRTKRAGEWVPAVPYRDKAYFPRGYAGTAGKACVECHRGAGTQDGYGVRVRGDDHCFTFPVLVDGTLTYANLEK